MKKIVLWLATLTWAFLIWRLTTTAQIVMTDNSWLQNILMVLAHFTFFGTLAFFLNLSIFDIRYSKFSDYVAVAVTSLYGLIIEFVQRNIPGRSADPFDWLLDTLGAVTFLLAMKKLQSKL